MNLNTLHQRLIRENEMLALQGQIIKIEDSLEKKLHSEKLEKELMKEIISLNAKIMNECAVLGKLK